MLTEKEIVNKYNNGEVLNVSIIGDSTSAGIEANAGPNLWTNGFPYAATNQPNAYPNLDPSSPYYINASTYPSQAQQDNQLIPTAVRKLWNGLLLKNASSVVNNWSVPGWDAATHIASGTVAQVLAQLPKPDVCIINLGINSAKNRVSMIDDLRVIVDQLQSGGVFAVLAQPNNIGVTGSPAGAWSETELPDNWYPLDYWPTTVGEIKSVSAEKNTGFVNVGDATFALDITKLYDPFHPTALGFEDIANRYLNWFKYGTRPSENGAMLKTFDGKSYHQPHQLNSQLRIKSSTGETVWFPVERSPSGSISDRLIINKGGNRLRFGE